jgi:hypothetical protein
MTSDKQGVQGYNAESNYQVLTATEFELLVLESSMYDESQHWHITISRSHLCSSSSFAFGLIYYIHGYHSFLSLPIWIVSSQQMFLDQKPLGIVWMKEQNRTLYNLYWWNFLSSCFLQLSVAVHAFCCELELAAKLCVFTLFSHLDELYIYRVVWLPALAFPVCIFVTSSRKQ